MPVKNIQVAVKYGVIGGLTQDDLTHLVALDSPRDGYLDATELGAGLLSPRAPVVGRLFTAGLTHPQQGRHLVAALKDLNPVQQFNVLRQLASPQQAQVIHALSKVAPRSDLHYIWYQFVFAESGILGGIFLNHLRAVNPALAEALPREALNACSGEFRKQLQDHLKVAQSLRDRSPSDVTFFPDMVDARQFLESRDMVATASIPPQVQALVPHLCGKSARGAVVVIQDGRGTILTPKTGFQPARYAVEVARKIPRDELKKRYEEGERLVIEKQFDAAIRIYEQILREDPQEYYATLNIGIAHNARKDARRALHYYQQAAMGWDSLLRDNPRYFEDRLTEKIRYEYTIDSIPLLKVEIPE